MGIFTALILILLQGQVEAAPARHAPTRPSAAPSATAELSRAQQLILEAQQGSLDAAEAAAARLQPLVEADPAHARARALLGMAHLLRARDAPLVAKLPTAREGFRQLDRAVASEPDDVEIRLLRAVNSSQVPLMLGRREVAAADFAWLLKRIKDGRNVSSGQQRRIFFHAGSFALHEGRSAQAISLLKKARAVDSIEPANDIIESMLALARRQSNPPNHVDHEEEHQQETAAP